MGADEVMRKAAAAVAEQRMPAATVERLLGFLAGQAAGFPPPSASTWKRRASELRALGLPVPPTPEQLRFEEPPGAVRERRRTCRR